MVQKMKKKLSDMFTARKENGNKGFTLVELIVVIVILAILIGVTIGGVFGYVNKSRINTDINNAAAIQSVLATLATDSQVAANKGNTATLTWTAKPATIAFTSGDFTGKNAAGANQDNYLAYKLGTLLTDGLPASKSGATFKIEIKTENDGTVKVSCKAYNDTACTDELDPEE